MSQKVTLNITDENIKIVEELSKKLEINKTTVVNKAIILEKFINDAINDGGLIIVQDKNGNQKEVVFR